MLPTMSKTAVTAKTSIRVNPAPELLCVRCHQYSLYPILIASHNTRLQSHGQTAACDAVYRGDASQGNNDVMV